MSSYLKELFKDAKYVLLGESKREAEILILKSYNEIQKNRIQFLESELQACRFLLAKRDTHISNLNQKIDRLELTNGELNNKINYPELFVKPYKSPYDRLIGYLSSKSLDTNQ